MEDHDSKAKKGAGDKNQAVTPRKREHILIVDDENLIVRTVKESLEKLGYRVTGCTQCSEALETLRQEPQKFDLVITDFNMPQMNGLELAQELNRLHPDLPIILYSAFHNVVSPEKARGVGIKDYLLKPVRVEKIHQAIRRVLDSGLPGREFT